MPDEIISCIDRPPVGNNENTPRVRKRKNAAFIERIIFERFRKKLRTQSGKFTGNSRNRRVVINNTRRYESNVYVSKRIRRVAY